MSQTDIFQLAGTFSIAVLGLLFYRISTKDGDWFCKYGREALSVAAAFQLTSVVVRLGVLFHVITQTDARTVNGLVAFGFVCILVQIVLTHRAYHERGRA